MPAPKGNRYGVDSKRFFKPKKFTPNQLKKKFFEYLDYNSTKTVSKQESIKSGDKAGTTMEVKLHVPLTKKGFAMFLGITYRAYQNYGVLDSYKEYFPIVEQINNFIEVEQLEGTTVGIYSTNIIARLQGLKEKTDITTDGNEIPQQIVMFQIPNNGRDESKPNQEDDI